MDNDKFSVMGFGCMGLAAFSAVVVMGLAVAVEAVTRMVQTIALAYLGVSVTMLAMVLGLILSLAGLVFVYKIFTARWQVEIYNKRHP